MKSDPSRLTKNPLFRTSILLALVFLTLFLALLFLPRTTKKSPEKPFINVLNWTSYIPDSVLVGFTEETGIKINYSTYSSNEELLAKLSSSEPGMYDLVFPSDYMLSLLAQKNLLSPLDLTKINNKSNLNPLFLNQAFDPDNSYSLPFLLATTVFVYDSTSTPPLTSYKDLADSRRNNDLVLLDDERILIGSMLLASGFSMNDTSPDHLEKALTFYETIRPNIKAFDSDSPKTFFITREVSSGLIWNAEAALAREDNQDLKIVYPAEGFALSMDSFAIPAGSKREENVYKFIDYLLRPDVAKKIVEEYPYISPVSEAETLSGAELTEIFSRGIYIENHPEAQKLYDKLWIKFK